MTAYLITACGAVFLSVIVSFVIPQGKLNGTITFVMRMICIAILVLPLTKLFVVGGQEQEELVDYGYVCDVYSRTQERFGAETECDVVISYDGSDFFVESVTVGITGNYDSLSHEIYEYLREADYINITVYESG